MKNTIRIILVMILFQSCQDRDVNKEYVDGDFIAKGTKVNGKFEGQVKYYDSNGVVIATSCFSNGILNGPTELYYPNGKKYQDQYFMNGKIHGYLSTFNKDGKLKYKQYYYYGNPCGPELNYINGQIESYSFVNFEHDLLFEAKYSSKGELFVFTTQKDKIFYNIIATGDTSKNYHVHLFTPDPPEMNFSYRYILKDKFDKEILERKIEVSDFYSEFDIMPNDSLNKQYIDVEYFDSKSKKRKQWVVSNIFGE